MTEPGWNDNKFSLGMDRPDVTFTFVAPLFERPLWKRHLITAATIVVSTLAGISFVLALIGFNVLGLSIGVAFASILLLGDARAARLEKRVAELEWRQANPASTK